MTPPQHQALGGARVNGHPFRLYSGDEIRDLLAMDPDSEQFKRAAASMAKGMAADLLDMRGQCRAARHEAEHIREVLVPKWVKARERALANLKHVLGQRDEARARIEELEQVAGPLRKTLSRIVNRHPLLAEKKSP